VRITRTVATVVYIIVLLTIQTVPADAQSGRRRPRVSTAPSAPPPPPPTVPAGGVVEKQEQQGSTFRYVLRNGLTVIVDERHAAPLVSIVAFIRPTSAPSGDTSSARLLQRILMRGTQLRPAAKPAKEMRALGGFIEAVSRDNGSIYYSAAPPNKLNQALAIEADLLQNPLFDAQDVKSEMALAATHRRYWDCAADNAERLLKELSDAPETYDLLRRRENGSSLAQIDREQLIDLYRKMYRPENTILALVGDLVPFNALVQVQQAFGNFTANAPAASSPEPSKSETRSTSTAPSAPASQKTEAPNAETAASSEGLMYLNERGGVSQSVVSVSFRVPGLNSADWPAVEVLSAILGVGRASRLYRSLVNGQMAASQVQSRIVRAGEGVLEFEIWVGRDAGSIALIDSAESALFRELDKIRRELPSESEMARAKSLLEQRQYLREGSYLIRALRLAEAEAGKANLKSESNYQANVRAVTARDVQRVAAKYLSLQNATIRELEPPTAPPRTFDSTRFTSAVAAWAPGFLQPVEAGSVREADPKLSGELVPQGTEKTADQQFAHESIEPLPVKDFSTLNGPRAFVREDHSQPLVTIGLMFQGGRLLETPATAGITELMLRGMTYGTPRRSFDQVTQELEQLGANLSLLVEPDSFGFLLSVPSRNADRVLRVLRDIVEEPAFRDDEMKRAALTQQGAIRFERDSSLLRANQLMRSALFPGHPYSFALHGTEEAISKITPEQLQDWHARLIKRQLPLVVIVGDTEGSALISGQIAEGFRRRELDSSLQVKIPGTSLPSERAEPMSQPLTVIALGFQGPKSDNADHAALDLLVDTLTGRGGILMTELRDRQGLVLQADARNDPMFVAGAISIEALMDPANEARARAAVLALVQRVSRTGLTQTEFAISQSASMTRLVSLQSQTARVIAYTQAVVYGRQASDVDTFPERANNVTPADLKRVAASYLKGAPSIGIVRGRPDAVTAVPAKTN